MTPLVDTNLYVGRWPFRRLPGGRTDELVAKLKAQGVSQAWTGSFEGMFQRDIAGVNARLAQTCRAHGKEILVPFGSINLTLPDWEDDLARCHQQHRMPGVRLHPSYHGYQLDDSRMQRLLTAAAEQNLIVQLALSMEDPRTQNPVFRVPPVDCRPLAGLVQGEPKLRLVVLGALRTLSLQEAANIAAAGDVCFDIAMLEGVGGVRRLIDQVGGEHVVFGSHAPLFYFESAALKLRESELAGFQLEAIRSGNARRLLSQ